MATEPGFDLAATPWITVRRVEGSEGPTRLGLRDVLLHADEIAALEVGPAPALSALYRILYAVTSRVTGLDSPARDVDTWLDLRDEIAERGALDAGKVEGYFTEQHGRFDLFGERPFLQDPRLREQCPKSSGLNKLVFGRPAGNNHVWFGHHRDADPRPLDSAEAVSHLLMWIYYGPSGRCTSRTVGATTAADVSAGPLRGALSYHPEGSNLLTTLLAGLVRPDQFVRPDQDLCPWEEEDLPDPTAAPRPTPGPRARWTGNGQHALLLVPDAGGARVVDAYATWALRDKRPRFADPYLIWQLSQAGNLYPRPADSARALWRDVDALLLNKPLGSTEVRRPEVFKTLLDTETPLRVRALGFEQDGKTKDVQYVAGTTPGVLDLIEKKEERVAREIGALRVAGEMYGFRVVLAVKRAWAGILDEKIGSCAWADEAAALYWPDAEREFWSRVHERDFDGSSRTFRSRAETVYDLVTARAPRTARATRAVERARVSIYGGKRTGKARTGEPTAP